MGPTTSYFYVPIINDWYLNNLFMWLNYDTGETIYLFENG